MKITSEEFFRHYANGERDFFGIELRNADLSRADWKDDNPNKRGQKSLVVHFSLQIFEMLTNISWSLHLTICNIS